MNSNEDVLAAIEKLGETALVIKQQRDDLIAACDLPLSTCMECGEKMNPGTQKRCRIGGWCSWHVPVWLLGRLQSAIAKAKEGNA